MTELSSSLMEIAESEARLVWAETRQLPKSLPRQIVFAGIALVALFQALTALSIALAIALGGWMNGNYALSAMIIGSGWLIVALLGAYLFRNSQNKETPHGGSDG